MVAANTHVPEGSLNIPRVYNRMSIRRVIFAFLSSSVLLSTLGAAPVQPRLGLHLAPCTLGKTQAPARCGTFGVYENRDSRSGRIIAVHLIVLPAKHHALGAITEIGGGPGEASTDFAAPIADGQFGPARAALRNDYDYVFMDDRGMGQSNAFDCDLTPPNDPAAYMRYLYPPKYVRACRGQSVATHDLTKYNTNNAVDDLDDIRAALGYDKIILSGGSYGTFFSLVYVRRHGEHVRSAILDGVDAPHFQAVPGEPMGVQKAIDDLFVKCAADASCRAHFPHFKAHFSALLRRFDGGPVAVPVQTRGGKTQTVKLSKEVFVDSLRHVLYDPYGASYVPYVVERAYANDYAPLGRMMRDIVSSFAHILNMGAFLSYSCADWTPFISSAELADARAHSFASDLRFQAQQQACATIDVPAMPASFNDPVRSGIPVLMIMGSDDPATPPQYGLEALKYLPNGRAVLVKGGGHGADTACTDNLYLQFVRSGSARGLDVSKCAATLKLPPFATSMKGWQ